MHSNWDSDALQCRRETLRRSINLLRRLGLMPWPKFNPRCTLCPRFGLFCGSQTLGPIHFQLQAGETFNYSTRNQAARQLQHQLADPIMCWSLWKKVSKPNNYEADDHHFDPLTAINSSCLWWQGSNQNFPPKAKVILQQYHQAWYISTTSIMCHSYLARHNLDFASVLARLSGLVIFTQPKAAVSQESLQIDITLSMQLRATKTKNSKNKFHRSTKQKLCFNVYWSSPYFATLSASNV